MNRKIENYFEEKLEQSWTVPLTYLCLQLALIVARVINSKYFKKKSQFLSFWSWTNKKIIAN